LSSDGADVVANLKASLQQAADDVRASTVRYHFRPKSNLRRLTSNDRVGTSDGGNDIFDDPLRQTPSDTFDPVLLGTVGCLLVQPLDVVRVVVVKLLVCRAEIKSLSKMLTESEDENRPPLNAFGHSSTLAHSMQCSGSRGVLAIVQMGNTVGGVNMSIYHIVNSLSVLTFGTQGIATD
jgi:hypothetical protein